MATLSFAHDIRAMFRDKDIQEMMDIANFDLSNYADVRSHAADVLSGLPMALYLEMGPCPPSKSPNSTVAKRGHGGLRVPGLVVKRSKLRKGGSPNTALVKSLG